jgi:hypothetical protein
MGVRSVLALIGAVVITVGVGTFVIMKWSWVFSKRINGTIVSVERVTEPSAIFSSRATEQQIHSYSVLVRGNDGTLYTSSSEDRQWQVAKKGYCVEALLYRYPPWDLQRAGTFFNARLKRLYDCPNQPRVGEDAVSQPIAPSEMPPPEVPAQPEAAPDSLPPESPE